MNKTKKLLSTVGKRYTVSKNDAGIVIEAKGNASNSRSIDVNNNTNLSGGISVSFYKDGKLMLKKKIEKYGQKETFVLRPKLYWGIASEIQEGELINSAVLNTDHFFELELDCNMTFNYPLKLMVDMKYQYSNIRWLENQKGFYNSNDSHTVY